MWHKYIYFLNLEHGSSFQMNNECFFLCNCMGLYKEYTQTGIIKDLMYCNIEERKGIEFWNCQNMYYYYYKFFKSRYRIFPFPLISLFFSSSLLIFLSFQNGWLLCKKKQLFVKFTLIQSKEIFLWHFDFFFITFLKFLKHWRDLDVRSFSFCFILKSYRYTTRILYQNLYPFCVKTLW